LELVSTDVVVVAGRQLSDAVRAADGIGAEGIIVDSAGVVSLVAQDIAGVLGQGRSIWVIAHESKDERTYRGGSWLGHTMDVIVRVEGVEGDEIKCRVEKSRWGALKEARIPILG
jgi:hypothetical protein